MVGITRCRCDPHQRSTGPRFPLRYACRGGLDQSHPHRRPPPGRFGDLFTLRPVNPATCQPCHVPTLTVRPNGFLWSKEL